MIGRGSHIPSTLSKFRVTEFDRSNQGIVCGQYRVHLRYRTCNCGRFDTLRYPRAHLIVVCQNLRLDPMSYVDEVYKLEYMYNMWRHVFLLVPDECAGQNQCHMEVVDGYVLDSFLVQLSAEVVVV
ncbi:hypothetical protein PVK06_035409 [Gossypium arboreum]|uniref:Uncharacterized protein n=1 Tax=Gossypium arboreum TaxID=29729 RepID=A0ABR0NGR0_GOSAR|nr:hypothetical protein PVK06_035409 [Gossypium arboreum]